MRQAILFAQSPGKNAKNTDTPIQPLLLGHGCHLLVCRWFRLIEFGSKHRDTPRLIGFELLHSLRHGCYLLQAGLNLRRSVIAVSIT